MHFLGFSVVAHIFLEMLVKLKDFLKDTVVCHIFKEIPPDEDTGSGTGCFLFMK